MRLIRGLHNLHLQSGGRAVTIGNFDGVHLGHQAVLGRLAEKADELGLPTTVVCFEPQPMEYFRPEQAPARLTRFREKLLALRRFSVSEVLCLPFNRSLAEMSPQDFIQRILVDGLNVQYLVVGDDFRFGKDRAGDFTALQQAGQAQGFQVVNMHTFAVQESRVSSTRVREALASGDLLTAEQCLGRPYRMLGRVAHGDKRGRTIGFPTANIFLHRRRSPVQGVFAVEVFGLHREPLQGVANVGTRPTVDGTKALLEIHLFDFDEDIYGRYIAVDFLNKLRPEMKYDSFEALKAQILRDADNARAWFAQQH